MTGPLSGPEHETRRLRSAFVAATAFAGVLWAIEIADLLLGFDLGGWGIYPRRAGGLLGILAAPLVHGSPSHLVANTAPILVLGTALLYGYPRSARIVLPAVYLGSGAGVWLFAREAYHIGASGLVFGALFFVFTIGALRWDRRAIALSMIVFLLYGGMIWGVLPGDPRISFESHLAGAVIGTALAVLLKTRDPAPPEKRYSWEDEDAGDGGEASAWKDEAPDAVLPGAEPPEHKPVRSHPIDPHRWFDD